MKKTLNRGISLLLSVCLVLGIFAGSGLTLARAEGADPKVETVVSDPENLIANGTFGGLRDVEAYAISKDVLPVGWEQTAIANAGADLVIEATDMYARTGKYSVHVAGTSAATFNFCDNITINPEDRGKDFVVSIWVRGTVETKTLRCGIAFTNDGVAATSVIPYLAAGTHGGWTLLEAKGTIPEKAVSARVKPIEVVKALELDIYADDAVFTIGDSANLLANASFEEVPVGAKFNTTPNVMIKNAEGWTPNAAVENVSASGIAIDPDDATNVVWKLWDNLDDASANTIPNVNYGAPAIEVGSTYKFSVQYKMVDATEGFKLAVNLRGNYSSSTGYTFKSPSATYDAEKTGWQPLEATFTVTEDSVDKKGVVAETFYAMFSTGKAATGTVYIDNMVLTKVCDEHTWVEEVTGEGTCVSPLVTTKTCSDCGKVEVTTATYDHVWTQGACATCGAPCEHDAPAGYCVICGLEMPVKITEPDFFIKGALDSGRETVTSYTVSESWQFAPYTFGGSYKHDGIIAKFTNEWATDGDWSFYMEDGEQEVGAISINQSIKLDAPVADWTQVDVSADFWQAAGHSTLTVQAYKEGELVQSQNASQTALQNSIGYSDFDDEVSGSFSKKGYIPAGTDELRIKIATPKKDANVDVVKLYLDNLVVAIDGVNLLTNGSFETLPFGAEPVESTGFITLDYSKAANSDVAYWYGLGDKDVENEIVEEMIMIDRDGKQTGVLHVVDTRGKTDADGNALNPNGTIVNYYMYNLPKNTNYVLKFEAKRTTDNGLVTITELGGETGNTQLGEQLNVKADSYVSSTEWESYEIKFSTDNADYSRVKIAFSTSSDATTEVWYDNFSLVVDCDHKWENPVVSEADCVNAATRTVTCACGAIGVTEVGTCNENHVLVEATCTTPSYCSVPGCGYIAAEALEHDCSNVALEEGATAPCARCGVEVGHRWADEEGVISGTCNRCDTSCAHVYDNECDADCNICGAVRDAGHVYDGNCDFDCNVCEEVRVAPHTLGDAIPAKVPANCLEEGYEEHWICEDCGAYFLSDGNGGYYETNPAWLNYTGEHTRPEGTPACAVVACEVCGEDSYGTELCDRGDAPACQDATCINCGDTVYGEGHSYGYDEEGNSLIPLCQAGDCIYCGEHLDYIYECENGSYAPCSVDGECSYGCGKQFPATGIHELEDPCAGGLCWMCWEEIEGAHNYVDGACSNCGEADPNAGPKKDDNLAFLQEPSLSFQDYIGVQTLIWNSLTANYDRIYVEAIQKTPDGDVRSELEGFVFETYFLVFDQPVLSWSMAEEITLTLYAEKDGELYIGQSYTESVETLALGMLEAKSVAGNEDAALCKVLVNMLNYGATVQTVFKHNETQLPNTQIDAYAKYATTSVPEMTASIKKTGTGKVQVLQDSISMQSKVELQMLFAEDLSAYTAKAIVNGEPAEVIMDTEIMGVPGWTVLRVAVSAYQMRETFTIALYDAEGNPVTSVYEVSAEAYAKSLTGDQVDVSIAMMRYGDAVYAYAN